MKVLLIDDEAPMMKPSFRGLRSLGAEMLYAETEECAQMLLAEHQVDAILMDGNLGYDARYDSIRGADIVKRLRAMGITIKIVMFSSDDKNNTEGIASGASGSFNKKRMWEEDDWENKLLEALS